MVTFTEYTANDYDKLALVFQNPDIMRFTLDDCYSDNDLRNYHNNIMSNNKANNRKQYEFKVYHKDIYIGFADFEIIRPMVKGGIAEIGYLLLPDFWGKGLGTIIATELIQICFDSLKLHKVVASCNVENIGSWKVMEKIGMKREGTFEAHRIKNGKYVDEYKYGLVNKAFLI